MAPTSAPPVGQTLVTVQQFSPPSSSSLLLADDRPAVLFVLRGRGRRRSRPADWWTGWFTLHRLKQSVMLIRELISTAKESVIKSFKPDISLTVTTLLIMGEIFVFSLNNCWAPKSTQSQHSMWDRWCIPVSHCHCHCQTLGAGLWPLPSDSSSVSACWWCSWSAAAPPAATDWTAAWDWGTPAHRQPSM